MEMDDQGFWIKGAPYMWKEGKRYYYVQDDDVVYDSHFTRVNVKDLPRRYHGELYLLPLYSERCSKVNDFFMANLGFVDGVLRVEGEDISKSPSEMKSVGNIIHITEPEMKIDRKIHNKKGVILCHGKSHRIPQTFGLDNVNWILVDKFDDADADITDDMYSPGVLEKIGMETVDYVILHNCPLGVVPGAEGIHILERLLNRVWELLDVGGSFYFKDGISFASQTVSKDLRNKNMDTQIRKIDPIVKQVSLGFDYKYLPDQDRTILLTKLAPGVNY